MNKYFLNVIFSLRISLAPKDDPLNFWIVFEKQIDDGSIEVHFTKDLFNTTTKSLVIKPGGYSIINKNFYSIHGYLEDNFLLFIGTTKSKKPELSASYLPFNDIMKFPAIIRFDEKDERVYLWTCSDGGPLLRDLYVSDETGTRYVKSMANLSCIEKLDETVFLLNTYHLQQGVALISYNKAGSWHPLRLTSKENETFHLYCGVSKPQSYQGLIIGIGNIGPYIVEDPDQALTFMSRDGGVTWRQLKMFQGSFSFQIVLHGSILLAYQDRREITELFYSLNQGLSWETLHLSNTPIKIFDTEKIILESQSAKNILLTGSTKESGYANDVIINLDLESLGKAKYCADSDYEIWSPSGLDYTFCLLGKHKKFLRRKEESLCLDLSKVSELEPTACECTDYDWECDFGYERQSDASCTLIIPILPMLNWKSTGYRKIPGSTCIGGIAPSSQSTYVISGLKNKENDSKNTKNYGQNVKDK